MFAALAVVLVIELLTFGGVTREVWLGTLCLSIAGFAVLFSVQAIRGVLNFRLLAAVASILVLSLLIGAQLSAALLAGAWAWYAATRSPQRLSRFFHVLIVIAVFESLLGMFQYFVQPGWIFGYQNMFNRVSGTLINHNHYAGLLEMLGFIPFGLAYTRLRQDDSAKAYLYLLVTALMALAIVFSLSRMGMGSFFMALLVVFILMKFRDSEGNIERNLGLGFLGLVLAGIMWIGVDVVVDRYGQLITTSESAESAGSRMGVYHDTLKMISENPLGVGHGKYQDIFRRYQSGDAEMLFDHTHNDYLETAAEWGILPAAIFWFLIFAALARAIRLFFTIESTTQRGILLSCIGGIVALLIHSLADFNLQIPVNATLFFALVGVTIAFPLDASQGEADFIEE